MSQPFDASMKHLLTEHGADWLAFLDLAPVGPLEPIDTALATVNVQADKVFQVRSDPPWIWHLEMQSGWDDTLALRAAKYNLLLVERFDQPVRTSLVLLKRKADMSDLVGVLRTFRPDGEVGFSFHYDVIRIWQIPADRILGGGVGILPLAPVCDVPEDEVPLVMQTIADRFVRETSQAEAKTLWATTYLLLGLRFSEAVANQLISGVIRMEESTTYQAIHDKGRQQGLREGIEQGKQQGIEQGKQQGIEQGKQQGIEQGVRSTLVRIATKKFGQPDRSTLEQLEAITVLGQLQSLSERVVEVDSWEALLETQ